MGLSASDPIMVRAFARIEASARAAAHRIVKAEARSLARHPARLDRFSPGLSQALPDELEGYARAALSFEARAARPHPFGGIVPAANAKAVLIYARALRRYGLVQHLQAAE